MTTEALFSSNLEAIYKKSPELANRLKEHKPSIQCEPIGSDVHLLDGKRILRGEPYLAYEKSSSWSSIQSC